MARIIVIDDDQTTLSAARALLEKLGHEAITAASGVEGVVSYLAFEPDLVLTDIFMPHQDGFETLKRLKALNPQAKVVCMSIGPDRLIDAVTVRDTMLRFATEFGADGSLTKPLRIDDLRDTIDKVLKADAA
ncbi:response regulator [Azospirillum soli]|uniref:response regulator n=1 Tax=Azospirillum soli TaxID=1304799 RepID=UPI001AE9B8F8|nr:response regulator [Azospirillum soli]MBP2312244.1 CheY-like chemotaxis protein [Azospirillum soli]